MLPLVRKGYAVAAVLSAVLLAACASPGGGGDDGGVSGGGGDFGPNMRLDPDSIADAVPRYEPVLRAGNTSPYTVLGKTYTLLPSASGYDENGMASWYGLKFHGNRTANGDVYDMYGMTAAHKTLPIPVYVRVTNLDNGRTAVVRVNDRGPFHDDRIIDLSFAAASKLAMVDRGTARVRVEAIDVGAASPRRRSDTTHPTSLAAEGQGGGKAGNQWIQAGVYSDYETAVSLRARLLELLETPVVIQQAGTAEQPLHQVRIGPLRSTAEIDAVNAALLLENISSTLLVRD